MHLVCNLLVSCWDLLLTLTVLGTKITFCLGHGHVLFFDTVMAPITTLDRSCAYECLDKAMNMHLQEQ